MAWRSEYKWRHAISNMAALTLSVIVGYFISSENIVWAAAAALVTVQTSRGTPARQALYLGFTVVLAVIAGFLISHYVVQLELYMSVQMGVLLVCSFMLMLRQPANLQISLQWMVPALFITVSSLWQVGDEMALASRLVMLATGGLIGLLCGLLVFPVQQYHEFRLGITPMLTALIEYSSALQNQILSQAHHAAKIDNLMKVRRDQYPEWVFEAGFNRNFRSGFRYVLVQLDKILEGFFSLDYHARQDVEPEMMVELAPHLALVLQRNQDLLCAIRSFFNDNIIEQDDANFTDDITALHEVLGKLLPASAELLDLSPNYTNISALARDAIDVRELLLQVIGGLPMNDFAVQIKSGSGV